MMAKKKIVSLLLALVMALSMTSVAFAAKKPSPEGWVIRKGTQSSSIRSLSVTKFVSSNIVSMLNDQANAYVTKNIAKYPRLKDGFDVIEMLAFEMHLQLKTWLEEGHEVDVKVADVKIGDIVFAALFYADKTVEVVEAEVLEDGIVSFRAKDSCCVLILKMVPAGQRAGSRTILPSTGVNNSQLSLPGR